MDSADYAYPIITCRKLIKATRDLKSSAILYRSESKVLAGCKSKTVSTFSTTCALFGNWQLYAQKWWVYRCISLKSSHSVPSEPWVPHFLSSSGSAMVILSNVEMWLEPNLDPRRCKAYICKIQRTKHLMSLFSSEPNMQHEISLGISSNCSRESRCLNQQMQTESRIRHPTRMFCLVGHTVDTDILGPVGRKFKRVSPSKPISEKMECQAIAAWIVKSYHCRMLSASLFV